jgi:hypothetical protein
VKRRHERIGGQSADSSPTLRSARRPDGRERRHLHRGLRRFVANLAELGRRRWRLFDRIRANDKLNSRHNRNTCPHNNARVPARESLPGEQAMRMTIVRSRSVVAMLAVVLLVAYIPQISLFVPHLVFGK